jgi:hemerythrin-like domain-containing protein
VQFLGAMNAHALSRPSDESLYAYMTASHRALSGQFEQLLAAMEANAPDATALWNALDRELRAHMDSEERFILPAFAHVDPAEARALLAEHARFRELLLELGVAVDLHCIRAELSRAFIDLLRDHAAREDELLYRWAETRLSPGLAHAVRRTIQASLTGH